ncbi:hypothetical protein GUITHDRAFT_166589 [Guillardia theta CCMP2712]|uniref:Uncharacterized protein n=1 Tax=Guillardia theta (strain CCMP2712) TaxID=905079 RepID=L1IAJ7_GUITC|nr:hypothetical protein GUITHDRAFT_166589 [Guillardia theta CCMP2712]EKX32929.1 hypothetical protein GUITHDRAFT_166589 [Guillardia theta CCMP2712]|eukprot:XP_005819909.1 hypothetical protein GUITHDRAFT_166589 [Guillardia theta CCMP2712]
MAARLRYGAIPRQQFSTSTEVWVSGSRAVSLHDRTPSRLIAIAGGLVLIALVYGLHHTTSVSLLSDPSKFQTEQRDILRHSKTSTGDSQVDALIRAAAKEVEAAALKKVKRMEKKTRLNQVLKSNVKSKVTKLGQADVAPTFYENHKPGMLGIAAVSKWVPEDHPEGHKDCPLSDVDCDELWPWGKVHPKDAGPPTRDAKLGDNLIGLASNDDVVVETDNSGLYSKAHPYVDRFDHWPEESKKNKDLLYGSARSIIRQKYTGIGDVYVPIDKVEDQEHLKSHADDFANLVFGSWNQGFNKPHNLKVKKSVSMFDQPYRQHMSVASGNGKQVYHQQGNLPIGNSLGK